jgi:tyrosine-protein phosphatase SIW14
LKDRGILRMKKIARQLSLRRVQAASLALVFSLSIFASAGAKTKQSESFSTIQIKNFGQMDDRFYRGAQPKEEDYQSLAALGIKTIVDLRDDPKEYAKRIAESLGMNYINIPMSDKDYPSDAAIEQFLKLAADQDSGKFYVHCAGGRHRTGVIGAVYRYNFYNWDYDQVYKEMKDYDYYSRWGHGDMKKYVQDYHERIKSGQINTLVNVSATTN